MATTDRGHFGSRLGFILAAAGSAVGLGNIWKFPYETGENGGGFFVLVYLVCVVLIGFPVMVAEILVGRRAQRSPVGAFGRLRGEESAWRVLGWLGVITGFIILSYYSVVAGWSMNYALMSVVGVFTDRAPDEISAMFTTLYGSWGINVFWHLLFMGMVVGIVIGGVKKGIEAWARLLMPALFVLLTFLVAYSFILPGHADGLAFVFKPNLDKVSEKTFFEGLGTAFFSLSLGMGALLTYGSYLRKDDDVPKSAMIITGLDTLVAFMACMIMFPVIFSYGMEATQGPGLVFVSMPVAFSQMPGGIALAIFFFLLLFFAALTSGISLLEVVTSTVVDQLGWSRRKATLWTGGLIALFGLASAISGTEWFSSNWQVLFGGKNFFDTIDYLASNWFLPLGGLFMSVFVGWVMPRDAVQDEFRSGSTWGGLFSVWYFFLRFVCPVGIALVFLYKVGALNFLLTK